MAKEKETVKIWTKLKDFFGKVLFWFLAADIILTLLMLLYCVADYSIPALQSQDIGAQIAAAMTFILVLTLVVSIFYFVYGGLIVLLSVLFKHLKQTHEDMKTFLLRGLIGMVVTFLLFSFLNLALGFLGPSSFTPAFSNNPASGNQVNSQTTLSPAPSLGKSYVSPGPSVTSPSQ